MPRIACGTKMTHESNIDSVVILYIAIIEYDRLLDLLNFYYV